MIKKLQNDKWGPYQTQTQYNTESFTVTAGAPVLFQLNNLDHGDKGPHFYYPSASVNHIATGLGDLGTFSVHSAPTIGDQYSVLEESLARPNGNVLKWNFCELQFEIEGFLDNTHVDIWIVKQKRMPMDPWNLENHKLTPNLPHTSPMFKNVSGFGPDRVSYKNFRVLHHKRLFFNSKPSSTYADLVSEGNNAGEQPTVAATTRHIKHCSFKWRPNQLLKQLKHSRAYTEEQDHDEMGIDANPTSHEPATGRWSYENQNPLANTWCILTTDDKTTLGSSLDGDAVSVKVIRRNVWQDDMD